MRRSRRADHTAAPPPNAVHTWVAARLRCPPKRSPVVPRPGGSGDHRIPPSYVQPEPQSSAGICHPKSADDSGRAPGSPRIAAARGSGVTATGIDSSAEAASFPSFMTSPEARLVDVRKPVDRLPLRAGWNAGEVRTRVFRHTWTAA
jgi:hypothetical protein